MPVLAWHQLQAALAGSLPDGVLHTRHRFVGYSEVQDGITAEFDATGGGAAPVAVRCSVLVGADGGQSGVREALLGDGPPHFMGTAIWRAITHRWAAGLRWVR